MGSLIVTCCIVLFLALAVCSFMWKLSKWLLIPLRVIIFAVLLLIVWRVLATRSNIQAIHDQVKQSPINGIIAAVGQALHRSTSSTDTLAQPAAPASVVAEPLKPASTCRDDASAETADVADEKKSVPSASPAAGSESGQSLKPVVSDIYRQEDPFPSQSSPTQSVFDNFKKMNMSL